jgi:hypothetical protein
MIMNISFRQSATRREPVLECGRCGALVTDTARHTDWHRGLEGGLETSIGHGAVLSEDQAVEHGLVPDPEYTAPPTSSEVAREEERLRKLTGQRNLRLYPFPAPVHAVPAGSRHLSPEARWVEKVYAYFGLSLEQAQDRTLSQELDAYLVALRRAARDRAVTKHGAATTPAHVLEEYRAMEPEVEQSWQEQRDRARSQVLDASLRDLSERLDQEEDQDDAVAEAMRRQGASVAQIARGMELRRARREQEQSAEPVRHGTDDTYPYGGDYDAGRPYTITCFCGWSVSEDLDGTVESEYEAHLERAQEEVEQPSDAGIGPQPLTDPVTGRRRSPE